jgi:nucleotide-binding universal stress UspA family protein
MFTKIVVPLDGSQCGAEALDVALTLARGSAARLAVLAVVDPIVVAGSMPPSPALDIVLSDKETEARHLVDAAMGKVKLSGLTATGDVRLGVPYEEILKFARRENADAIVMGTHGRTGFKRFLMGSVAEKVLRGSKCPVIVVREHARAKVEA